MVLELSEITMHDLDTAVAIHCEAWRDAYIGFMDGDYISRKNGTRREKWAAILADNPAGKHFLIRDRGIPVGMISMDLPREDAEPHTYEVFGLYILPLHMRKGYGTAAFALAEERIRQMGYQRISLWILEPNERAKQFWEKLGFVRTDRVKTSYYDKPIRVWRYIKNI